MTKASEFQGDKKDMKTKFFRIVALLLIIAVLAYLGGMFNMIKQRFSPTAYAVGDLLIDWGVLVPGDPIFTVNNMLPGDVESRDVDVTNNGTVSRAVSVRGDKTSETADFSTILDFVISNGSGDLYGGTSPTGPKTLADFFADSAAVDGLFLSNLAPSASTTYTFKATFPGAAGNEFQEASVVFDLQIGISIGGVPAECSHITFSGPPILGTSSAETIFGTLENDLIIAFEGNDKVSAFSGDDCIIGGEGNDELRGELDNDIIFGNEGDDLVVGAVGNDKLFGGEGNDTIRGENDDDYIEGNNGNDIITGGNGQDEIHGGDGADTINAESGDDVVTGDNGNDILDGGSDNDTMHGNNDNDTMLGQAGDDTLIGDLGNDSADGSFGTDTCDAEIELNCEP